MIQTFDINKMYETPTFTLCNPDYTERTAINANNKKAILRYNDVSEITLDIPEKYSDNGETKTFAYFKDIEIRRLILVENLGYFQIADVTENDDGTVVTKSVLARSLQYELAAKSIDYLNGTYKFYDIVNNFDENGEPATLMGFIAKYAKGWTIGDVDSALINKYRTMDISNRTVLDFIYNDVEEAYQCIFDFDFLNRIIHVKAVDSLLANPYNTDIYLSFDNLVQDIEIQEQSDEIRTKLYVYGQDLDIRRVNPTGAAYIINLDYYMNTGWMDQELINAITLWNNKINNYMTTTSTSYATLLSQLNDKNAELTALNSTLTTLKGELSSFNNIMSVRIEQGIDYSEILSQINAKTAEINAQQTLINSKKAEIEVINAQLSVINTDCRIENNFTEQQLIQLDKYLIEDTYTNDNYIITDLMTAEEIQAYAKELYDEARLVLQRIAQPRYVFSLDSTNFMFVEAFKQFTNQLAPGRIINIENSKGEILAPVLLKIEYNWDNPSDFNLEFGNRFRLSDNTYTYSELVGTANKTSGQVNNNWDALITFSKNYKSELNDLINNAFDVALKEIISSANQDMVWDSSGMTFRKWSELMQTYEDEQIKIINNKIVFTDDAWNSIKTVIGKIALSGGGTAYGIVAEAIVGRLLAGVNLVITNANNSFVIDENGFSFIIPDPSGEPKTVGLEDYISREIDTFAESLAGLVDGKITSYYQNTLPYSVYINVANNDERNSHIGDIWYNTGYTSIEFGISPNKTYMYQKIENGSNFDYVWKEIEAVPDELYDEVDKKKTVFVSLSENYTPTPPYSVGDLWAQSEYQAGELLVCTTNRVTGNYVASDWVVSNEYNKQLNDFITNTFSPTVTVIESLIDSKINAFYQNTAPLDYHVGQLNSLDDSAAFALAMSRLNDIWYDTVNKVAKKYSCNPTTGDIRTFSWVIDNSIPTDLIDIVDGKKTVFVSTSPTYTPTPPYSVGDLWAQREYGTGEMMVCINTKTVGQQYNTNDWVTSTSYMDNLNDFIQNTYTPTINAKIESFYQSTSPHNEYLSVNDNNEYNAWVGDIWYDTSQQKTFIYSKNFNGSNYDYIWKEISAVPDEIYDTIDGKKNVFVSISENYTPIPPYSVGDLWVQNEYQDGKLMVCMVERTESESYSPTDWAEAVKYTNDSSLNVFINEVYNTKIANIEKQLDNVIVTFYQALPPDDYIVGNIDKTTQPTAFDDAVAKLGDTWYDTINKVAKRYISVPETGDIRTFSWVVDDTIPLGLYDAVDGKKTIYFSTSNSYTPPVPYYKGDLWAQGDYQDGNLMISVRDNATGYNASDWMLANTSLERFIEEIEPQLDSKIASYYQDTQPHAIYYNISATDPNYQTYAAYIGDIWYDTANERTYMYVKIANGNNYDFIWKETDGVNPVIYDLVDGKNQIFLGLSEDILVNKTPILRDYDNKILRDLDNLTLKQIEFGNIVIILNGLLVNNNSNLVLNNNYYTLVVECLANTSYMITKGMQSNVFRVAYSTENNITAQSSVHGVEMYDGESSFSYLTGDNATFLYVSYYTGDNEPYTQSQVYSSLQIRSDKFPVPPYNIGDLWVQGSTGDMLVCRVPRSEVEQFVREDWILASKYTDDSSLSTFIDEVYTYKIREIEGQLDGMMISFYQPFAPDDYVVGIVDKNLNATIFNDAVAKLGDLWYDTINKVAKRYTCDPLTGDVRNFTWIVDDTIPLGLYDAIDGKKTIYFSTSEAYTPPSPYYTGDLWAQGTYQQGHILVAIRNNYTGYDSNDWILADTSLETFISDTYTPQMDGKISSFYQDTQPYNIYINIADTNPNFNTYSSYMGDIWYDTVNKQTYMYVRVSNGANYDFIWREVDGINQDIYDLVDGKNQIFLGLSDNLLISRPYELYDYDENSLEYLDNQMLQDLDYSSYVFTLRGVINTTTTTFEYNSSYYTVCVSCKPNTSYMISKDLQSNVFRVAYSKQDDLSTQPILFNTYNYDGESSVVYTSGSDATFILISYYGGSGEIYSQTNVYNSLQVRFDRYPTTPYDVGDLWVQGATGDILVCQYSRAKDELFVMSDWTRASKYTDDSTLDNFLSNIYINDITTLEMLIDSKIDTHYQSNAPDYFIGEINKANNVSEFNLALSRLGDIWYDTINKVAKVYSCNPQTGDNRIFMWVIDNTIPVDLFDVIDGKKTVFVSTTANYTPTPPYSIGDLWAQGTYQNGELMVCRVARASGNYVASDWIASNKYATTLENFINNIQPTIDSKITSYYGVMPYSNYTNISTSNTNYTLYMTRVGDITFYNGTTWMYTKTTNTSNPSNFDFTWKEIEAVPDELYDIVDSKKQVFYSNSSGFTPTPPYDIGDLWAQGTYQNGELMVCRVARASGNYVASDWIASNKYATTLSDFITNTFQPAIDGKIDYFWQAAMPHSEYTNVANNATYNKWVGDTWYNTSTKITYVYTKTSGSTGSVYNYKWVDSIVDIPQELYDEIDGKKSVYQKRPTSFQVNDIWLYEGAYNSSTNPNSDLMDTPSPSSGYYQSPYVQGTSYTYFKKDDLLVATADSTTYNPSRWKKYSSNIEKSNSSFEFVLNNDGVSIKNGSLVMTRGTSSRITLDPTNGIKIQKNTGTAGSPTWTDQLYADSSGNLVITGTITATAGSIGGWTIGSSTITAPSSVVGLYGGATSTSSSGSYQRASLVSGYNTVRFWAGNQEPSIAPFAVLNDGSLYAGAASITGTINAKNGNFSGRLYFNNDSNFYIDGSSSSTYRLYMYYSSTQYLRVRGDGIMEAYGASFMGMTARIINIYDPNSGGYRSSIQGASTGTVILGDGGGITIATQNYNNITINASGYLYLSGSSGVTINGNSVLTVADLITV